MKNKVLSTIKKYNMLQRHEGVVVGVSGGADSVALLQVLNEIKPLYNLKIYAVHVNHNLRGAEADSDENYVRELCKRLGVELFVFSPNVKKEAKTRSMTVEEAGRAIRYEKFEEVRQKTGSGKIAVAHNKNDNMETVLMNLFRGTGTKGMGGIPPVRGDIIRPLIEVERCGIENYCKNNGLAFCSDSTNFETDYTRNKIRLVLIPWLKENINQSVDLAIDRTAEMLRSENEFLDRLGNEAYKACVEEKNVIKIESFLTYDMVIRQRVVRFVFKTYVKSLKDITREHISSVCALAEGKSGRKINLPYGLEARRDFDRLIIEKKMEKNEGFCLRLEPDKAVYVKELNCFAGIYNKKSEIKGKLLYTNCFNCDIINGEFFIRSPQNGDAIYLKGVGGYKKLKKIFAEHKIGSEERMKTPVLVMGDEVLWVCGLKTNDLYKAEDGNLYFYFWKANEK